MIFKLKTVIEKLSNLIRTCQLYGVMRIRLYHIYDRYGVLAEIKFTFEIEN